MVEVAHHDSFFGETVDFGASLRAPSMDLLNGVTGGHGGMDDVDKLLQAFQPGQGSFDLPNDLGMDWNGGDLHTSLPEVPQARGGPGSLPAASAPQPQPFAGPVSRLGWSSQSPVPILPPASTPFGGMPPVGSPNGFGNGVIGSPADHSPYHSRQLQQAVYQQQQQQQHSFQQHLHEHEAQQHEQQQQKPGFPAIPPRSARRASVPATAPGGVSSFVTSGLYETRSTPPLWPIKEGDVSDDPSSPHNSMRPAMSADAHTLGQLPHDGATASSANGRRLRPSVRSASVGAERPLTSTDLDLGLSGAKAKERNRRAQKRFRERQKVKQQEAVQRVVLLEDALERLEVERSELSQKLKAMSSARSSGPDGGAGGAAKTEDSGSEQQMLSPSSSQERVLTLSVPAGRERHLTGSDIKKLTWPEYISLYENYLEEMAAMLLQAQGNGDSPAGHRLQRLCTELITVTAAMLMHDPTTKGRLHCMPLMSQPVSTPLAPPDSHFWHRVTMALCLSPQQRQNCLRLRNAHLHKVRDIMQDRYRINDMMQSTLPCYDFELQAARQHLRALQVSESLQRNLRQEQGLQLELSTTFFSQALTPIQMATAATESYPWWPDILAMLNAACDGME